jgi:hypothetical protein
MQCENDISIFYGPQMMVGEICCNNMQIVSSSAVCSEVTIWRSWEFYVYFGVLAITNYGVEVGLLNLVRR